MLIADQDQLMTMVPGTLEQLEDEVAAQLVKWGASDSGPAESRPASATVAVVAEALAEVELARL